MNKNTDLGNAIYGRAVRLYYEDTDRAGILTTKHVREAMYRVQAALQREVHAEIVAAMERLGENVSVPKLEEMGEQNIAWVNGEWKR